MHCIVAFAAPASDAGRAALAAMQWPRLQALLPRLALVERDEAEATTFSPPHERVLARALGWRGDDGRWPFAAQAARADGIDTGGAGERAWGLVSPVHWHVGTDQVSLADPEALQLDDDASHALFEAVRPLFESAFESVPQGASTGGSAGEPTGESARASRRLPAGAPQGMSDGRAARLVYGHPTRWYVAHESLAGLRTASLDRVIGRNVDAWLGSAGAEASEVAAALRRWRRLQAEVQMLLHAHPLNAAREAAGALPVNSFWLSGCGRSQPATAPMPLHIDASLRAAALAEDWPAWTLAWRRLEEGALLGLEVALRRGSEVRLTLAGERSAVTFAPLPGGLVARLKNRLAKPSVPALLASL